MEKFRKWEDKSCGINPFVPLVNNENYILKFFRLILFLIRLPLFLLLLTTFLIFNGLLQFLPFFDKVVTRLMFIVLGYFNNPKLCPDPRTLGFGKVPKSYPNNYNAAARLICSKAKTTSQLIICNNINWISILQLYNDFSPEFIVLSDSDIYLLSLSSFLHHSLKSFKADPPIRGEKVSLTQLKQLKKPIIVFPEQGKSNGLGILKFEKSFEIFQDGFEIGIIGINYGNLNNHLSPVGVFYQQSNKAFNSVQFQIILADALTNYNLNLTSKLSPTELYRQSLAKLSGNRSRPVELGHQELLSFLQFYNNYHKLKQN